MVVLLLAAALHQDPAVARALALLGPNAPDATVITVVTPHRLRLHGPQETWAARTTDFVHIEVANDSPQYKHAVKGDAIGLAAQLAHEAWHLANGPDEVGAYAEQLRVLRVLNARGSDLDAVIQAVNTVTRH